MTQPDPTLVDGERGGVAERFRYIPSPPCLPVDAERPDGAVPLSDLSEEARWALMPSIAAAVDVIHRYRVAHGSLSRETILASGKTVWITGVDAVWNELGDRGSPREKDLTWFRGECERWLGPSVQPGIGRTCRGMLASWREPPPVSKATSKQSRPQAPRHFVRNKRLRRRIPWRSVAVVLFIVSVVSGVAAWQLTSLPTYTTRTLRWGFRKLPLSTRLWIDPDGKFDPIGRRLRTPASQDYWSRLEVGLTMQRSEALVEVLSEPGDEYTELLRRFMAANDAGFLASVSSKYNYNADWIPRSIPRLKELLAAKLPTPAQRTIEQCILKAAGPEDISTIEGFLRSPALQDTVADAYAALARIDHPASIEKLIEGSREAGAGSRITYITTVFNHYSDSDVYRFLNAYSTSRRQASLADAWREILLVVERSPDRFRNRASKIFERLLVEAIPKTLAATGPGADADLLTTLYCLWRLQTVSPEILVERLSEPTPQGEQIRARLAAMLVGNADEPPEVLALPEGWDVPDEWFAAVLAGAADYPAPFVRRTISDQAGPKRLQKQSRLLALANIRPEPAREALAVDLSRNLFLNRDTWRTKEPLMVSSICSLLAAARNRVADEALARFFAPGPYGREFAAWEGMLVGAIVDPARHRALLKAAAAHPLPSIWLRARELSALADGDVAGFRNPDTTRPKLPVALEELVAQLETADTEADVFAVFSRQRTGHLAEIALGLSPSPGAVAVLHSRVDRSELQHSTYLLLANQPKPLDRRFDDILKAEPTYQMFDPSIMTAQMLRGDRRSLSTLRALAVGPRTGRNAPPLLHRATAVQTYAALLTGEASAEIVREILDVIDHDPSFFVRHAAAAAALRCVTPADKKLLVDFAANRPKLPPGVADILKLAAKL